MHNHQPPKPSERLQVFQEHGQQRSDPWFWLKNEKDPETLPYLKKENKHTALVLASQEALRSALVKELKALMKEEDMGVPLRDGPYSYYHRIRKGDQYSIYCRTSEKAGAEEEVLLDENELSKGKGYFDLGICDYSPNHRYLAYSYDETGDEAYTLVIKDLQTGKLLAHKFKNTSPSFEWTADSEGFYFVEHDELRRPQLVYAGTLSEPKKKTLIYKELDDRFFVDLSRSEDDEYVFILSEGHNMSEWHAASAHSVGQGFRVLSPRVSEHEYSVSHHQGYFYVLTNQDALDGKVIRFPVSGQWSDAEVMVPHREGWLIDDFMILRDWFVLDLREAGLAKSRVYDFASWQSYDIPYPDEVYDVSVSEGGEYHEHLLRIGYSSLETPPELWEFDLQNQTKKLLKTTEFKGFDASVYETKRLWATSHDGKQIPISVLMLKDLKPDGTHPVYLYGYGAYGVSLDAGFDSAAISLVNRGVIYAIAHVRGGMELGRKWYLSGKLFQKKNSFLDFISCAEFLVASGYAQAGRIVASGGSAGGLLVGAVANMRPELFSGVVANVPFVDVVNTMLDRSLPLTTSEFNEWGDLADPEIYRYVCTYSPYDNVSKQAYPHMLVLAGLHDTRVTYWEPAKWVAKLRAHNTASTQILLHTQMEAGHAGASGRYDELKNEALELGFVLSVLGAIKDTTYLD